MRKRKNKKAKTSEALLRAARRNNRRDPIVCMREALPMFMAGIVLTENRTALDEAIISSARTLYMLLRMKS